MGVDKNLDLFAKVLSGDATIKETYAVIMKRRDDLLLRALIDAAIEEGCINPIVALLFEADDIAVENGVFGEDVKKIYLKTKKKSKMLINLAERYDTKKN